MFIKIVLLLAVASTAFSIDFQIKNNSPDTPVFVQLLGTQNREPFTLDGGEEKTLSYDVPWSAYIWGRIDCYSYEECQAAGSIPTSRVEINIGYGKVFYDVSLVDGFNIPISVEAVGGHDDGSSHSCQKADCSYNLLKECPEELQVKNSDDVLVSCQSACQIYSDNLSCCQSLTSTPETCKSSDWPMDYGAWFKERCPDIYMYTFEYNDPENMFTCDSDKYVITFF